MQSFLTIFIAGTTAFMAMFMLSPQSNAQGELYALEITLEENGEVFSAPKVVVEPGKSYVIALEGEAEYDFSIDIPEDTRSAAIAQFERDLGQWASDFLLVNTQLSFDDRAEAKNLPDYGKAVSSNLLLRVGEPAREIRSIVPVADRGLFTRAGQPIETLAITIKGVPFSG